MDRICQRTIEKETGNKNMILEVAILNVVEGKEKQFEEDFAKAGKLISSMKGYIQHSLRKCLEVNNRYIL